MHFINSLWITLQENLEAIPGNQETIARITRCIIQIRETLTELKRFILEHDFEDQLSEINFFKVLLPNFYSQFLYHIRILQIEKLLPPGQDNQIKYLEKEIKRLAVYFEQHADWVLYFRSDASYLDHKHFLRHTDPEHFQADYDILLDQRFSSPGTYHFSKIKALELTQAYLDHKLAKAKNNVPANIESPKSKANLRWTGSKSDLIELLYALHSSKLFNDNEFLDVRQIANWLETTLNINLGNYYRVFQGIRIRKKSRTQFLDNLKENLIKRMDTTDENPRY